MSGVRFLRQLKTPSGEPLVYICHDNEGWFSLRQLAELFFPKKTEKGLQLTLWCAKHIQSCKYYGTTLNACTCKQLRDPTLVRILYGLHISVEWIVDMQSVQEIFRILDPHVRASVLLAFYTIIIEMLKKGGRKRAVSDKERMRIAASQEWKCKMCKEPFGKNLIFDIDHIFKWSAGGSNRAINLQALCPTCHTEKTEQDKQQLFEDIVCLSMN